MLRYFQALMPREEKFFGLFNRHARTLVDGAIAMRDLLEGGPGVAQACARIVTHENEANAIAREVLAGVRRSFITPFDRGDIKDLIGLLDDSIDQMQKTAKAITLFEVTAFEPPTRFAMRAKSCGTEFVCEHVLTADGGGTLLELTMRMQAVGFFSKLMSPLSRLMVGTMKASVAKDLDALAKAAERPAAAA